MSRIVLATGNPGKIAEFKKLLGSAGIEFVAQREMGVAEVPETAGTFLENALIKARHASAITGLPALADDSGLEVDALAGAPGVYSARFAGADASDADNIELLLQRLRGTPQDQRGARFHCLLACLRHPADPTPLICHGIWEGRILEAPAGDGGFGYDPVFWSPELGCSAAEIDRETKNHLSHRGQAMAALEKRLLGFMGERSEQTIDKRAS